MSPASSRLDYYYDAFRDQVLKFHGEEEPQPCDMESEAGELHEIRPLTPAWESFWRVAPAVKERAIRQLADQHLYDRGSGGFNRHADRQRGHAFLEAGGTLVETMCWLAARVGDGELAADALRVAEFSWSYRGATTDLPENSPTYDRWDKYVCTTEVGLWAGCLMRSTDLTGVRRFAEIAEAAVLAHLRYGYDERVGAYYGRLHVADGTPDGPQDHNIHAGQSLGRVERLVSYARLPDVPGGELP